MNKLNINLIVTGYTRLTAMFDMSITCPSEDVVTESTTGMTRKDCVLFADTTESPLVRELILDIKDFSCCFSDEIVPESTILNHLRLNFYLKLFCGDIIIITAFLAKPDLWGESLSKTRA